MTDSVRPSPCPARLPTALLEAFFPTPALLAGRLAASSIALYTRDCAAYVAFCGYDEGMFGIRAKTGHNAS